MRTLKVWIEQDRKRQAIVPTAWISHSLCWCPSRKRLLPCNISCFLSDPQKLRDLQSWQSKRPFLWELTLCDQSALLQQLLPANAELRKNTRCKIPASRSLPQTGGRWSSEKKRPCTVVTWFLYVFAQKSWLAVLSLALLATYCCFQLNQGVQVAVSFEDSIVGFLA